MKLEIAMNGTGIKKGIKIGAFVFFALMVCLQFGMLLYVNYTLAEGMLDFDSSLAIRHAVEMWKHRTIDLPYFQYGSSMELDCATFFAGPIYMVTNNLGLSMALVHGILYIMIAAIILGLCRNLRTAWYVPFITVLVVFTPYAHGMLDWSNMLFISAGQYEFRVMSLLLMLDLMFWDAEKRSRKLFWVLAALEFLLIFWTAVSCGNYVLLMIVLPLLLWVGLEWLLKRRVKLFTKQTILLAVYAVSSVAGYVLHNAFTQVTHRGNLPYIAATDFFTNIKNCLTGVIMLLGGFPITGEVSIISSQGIACLARFVFLIACIVFVVCRLRFAGQKTSAKGTANVLAFCCTVYACFSLFILMMTDSTYGSPVFEHRYHILWVYLLLVTATILVFEKNRWVPGRLMVLLQIGFLCCVVLINVSGWRMVNRVYASNDLETEKKVLECADKYDADAVYFIGGEQEGHRIRALDLEQYCISFTKNDGELQMHYFDFYSFYGDISLGGQKNIVVCSKKDFKDLPEWRKNQYRLVDETGDWQIYYSEINTWDGMMGPPVGWMKKSVDCPSSYGWFCEGTLKEDGFLYTDPAFEGYVFRSACMGAETGTYDITLSYENISGITDGVIDVITDGGEKILAAEPLPDGKSKIKLKDVRIDKTDTLEVRVSKAAGCELVIKKIEYTKKK